MSNHLARRSLGNLRPSTSIDRRTNRHLEALERSSALEHLELQIRQNLAQAQMISQAAVTQTAMATVTTTAVTAKALAETCPEVLSALEALQTTHVVTQRQRLEEFGQGR